MALKGFVVMAVLGALLIAIGLGMWSLPAGVVTAGAELVAGAYVAMYLKAKGGS